jgi:hypothetical protein
MRRAPAPSLLGRTLGLGLRVLRLNAHRGEENIAGESPGRQTIKEDMEHTFGITVEVGVTNFYVAAPKSAFPEESICAMRWWFIDHDHH